jgi:hypothetical protein
MKLEMQGANMLNNAPTPHHRAAGFVVHRNLVNQGKPDLASPSSAVS